VNSAARALLGIAALAAAPCAAAGESEAGASAPAAAPAPLDAATPEWSAASDAALAELRGGLAVQQTGPAVLGAVVSHNGVGNDVLTGSVLLSGGALANSQGLFVGTFNTGNNVAIQTNVIVQIHLE
jgi:hypothetical protein